MKQVSLNNNNILLDANNIYIYNKPVDNDNKQTVLEATTGSINVKVTGNFTKNVLIGGEFTASDRFLLGSSQGSNVYIFSDKHNMMMKHGATGGLYLYGNKITIGSTLSIGSTGYINIGFTGNGSGSVNLNGSVYLNGSILQPGGGAIYNAGHGISIDADNYISLDDEYFEFGTNVFNIKGNRGTLQLSSGGNSVKFCGKNGCATVVGSSSANYTVTPADSLTLLGNNISFTGIDSVSGRSSKNISFAVTNNKITLNSGGSIILSGTNISLSGNTTIGFTGDLSKIDIGSQTVNIKAGTGGIHLTGSNIYLSGSNVYLSGYVYLNGSVLTPGGSTDLSPSGILYIGSENKTTGVYIGNNNEDTITLYGSNIIISGNNARLGADGDHYISVGNDHIYLYAGYATGQSGTIIIRTNSGNIGISTNSGSVMLSGTNIDLSGSVYLNGSLLENGADLSPAGSLDIGREEKTTSVRIGNREGAIELIGSVISIRQGLDIYVFSGGSFVLTHP